MLLFGISQKGVPCDKVKECLENSSLEFNKENLNEIREKASNNIKKNQDYNKQYFDKRQKTPNIYNIGDYVMIKHVNTISGINHKLLPKYRGPYEIRKILENDRYLIKDITGMQLSRLPYTGVCAAANMKLYQAKGN